MLVSYDVIKKFPPPDPGPLASGRIPPPQKDLPSKSLTLAAAVVAAAAAPEVYRLTATLL